MLLLYLNTVTGEWFDADGSPFGYEMPKVSYKARETIGIMLKSSTPGAGELGVDPVAWPEDYYINGSAENIAAKITIDSDYIHKLKGKVAADISAGAVSTITLTIADVTAALVPPAGTVRLFSASGEFELVNYTARTLNGSNVVFTMADGVSLAQGYTAGAVADCDQAPYCQAVFNPEVTEQTKGIWGFELVVDSPRLREALDYSNQPNLPVEGLEVLFYSVGADGTEYPIRSYILPSFSIAATLGSLNVHGDIPDPTRDELAALVGALLNRGIVAETRNGESGAEIRIRLANLGEDTWSDWVVVGYSLAVQYSHDNITWSDSASADSYYLRFSADGGASWGNGIYIKGADGVNGADGKDGTSAGFGEIASTTETVESTESASVTVTATGTDEAKNFTFDFKIPKGEKGNDGQSFSPDQTGTTEEKATYDDMPVGFSFLDITEGLLYFKQSDTSGDWSEGMLFGKGEKGDTGAAAGFATPEISVTTLEPGTDATATVTASGESTNKLFRFAFAIPRGEKGEPGEVTEEDKDELKDDLKAYVQEELANGSW